MQSQIKNRFNPIAGFCKTYSNFPMCEKSWDNKRNEVFLFVNWEKGERVKNKKCKKMQKVKKREAKKKS